VKNGTPKGAGFAAEAAAGRKRKQRWMQKDEKNNFFITDPLLS
jgi:hypothetical protein